MDVKAIKTDADYQAALARIEGLMDAKTGTSEGDLLNALTALVAAYEERRFAIASGGNDDAGPV